MVSVHPDYFDSQPRDITSNSSSLERELASVSAARPTLNGDVDVDVTDAPRVDVATPDERVFDCDLYTDVIEMADVSSN